MIKEISIKYCESNEKYDLYVDCDYMGKHYSLMELVIALLRIAWQEHYEDEKKRNN